MAIKVINVFMNDVFQRIGKKRHEEHYSRELRPAPAALAADKEYGLALYWPRTGLEFLSLEARHGNKPFERVYHSDQDRNDIMAAEGMGTFKALGDIPPLEMLTSHHILAGTIAPGEAIRVTFVVDTDHKSYREEAEKTLRRAAGPKRNDPQLFIVIDAWLFSPFMHNRDATPETSDWTKINLVLRQIGPVLDYEGYVALDVGNTASTLVCLPAGVGKPLTEAMKVLDVKLGDIGVLKDRDVIPLLSQVRIDAIASPFDKNDNPSAASWVVGSVASADCLDGLVMSPKRLAAGTDWEKPKVFNASPDPGTSGLGSEVVELPRRVPAELLVCRMLQYFRQVEPHRRPDHLALTYPTTYKPDEMRQLREVVFRGFQRSSWEPPSDAASKTLSDADLERRVPVMLDEASAAAYFFLYRRILEAPGGLPRFRYLYPRGLNLLLYDCGGGTTDIALVKASSEAGTNKLSIGVRARSGVRGFGGDNITAAVFRILKTKLAFAMDNLLSENQISSKKLRESKFPDKVPDLDAYLTAIAATVNELVPTRFAAQVMDIENRRNRNFCLNLARWAEDAKKKLAEQTEEANKKVEELKKKPGAEAALKKLFEEARSVPLSKLGVAGPLWEYLTERFKQSGDEVMQDAMTYLKANVVVQRWEVDELVKAPIEKSVANCNKLIRTKLTSNGEEVDWVVASGNGARYPYIQEMLRQRLAVQFIDGTERFTMDYGNLKGAVAKGAVLYLMSLNALKSLDVSFDIKLCEHLPYHVGFHDPVTQTTTRLFNEHDSYEEMVARGPKKVEAQAQSSNSPTDRTIARQILLVKCWPEDAGVDPSQDRYTTQMPYNFDNDVVFPLSVSVNPDTKQFEVTDASDQQGKPIDVPEPGVSYESPFQNGDL